MPTSFLLYVLFLEIQVCLYDEKHFFRIERSTEAFVLSPLTHIGSYLLKVDIHFLVVALQDTTGVIIVNNEIHHIEDILVAIELLDT